MEERGEDEVSVFAAVSLPIFRTAVRERRREALALHRAATHELTAARLELVNRKTELRQRIQDADRRLGLYRDRLLPLAEATIEAESTAYESGGVTLGEVLAARRTLLDTRIDYDAARAEAYRLRSQYHRLTATTD